VRRVILASLAVTTILAGAGPAAATQRYRLELHLAPGARSEPTMLLMTIGGPVYCVQLEALARNVGASLACADYAPDGRREPRSSMSSGARWKRGDPRTRRGLPAITSAASPKR